MTGPLDRKWADIELIYAVIIQDARSNRPCPTAPKPLDAEKGEGQ